MVIQNNSINFGMATTNIGLGKRVLATVITGKQKITPKHADRFADVLIIGKGAKVTAGEGKELRAQRIFVMPNAVLDGVETLSTKFTSIRDAITGKNSTEGLMRIKGGKTKEAVAKADYSKAIAQDGAQVEKMTAQGRDSNVIIEQGATVTDAVASGEYSRIFKHPNSELKHMKTPGAHSRAVWDTPSAEGIQFMTCKTPGDYMGG